MIKKDLTEFSGPGIHILENKLLMLNVPYVLFDKPLTNLPAEIYLEDHLNGFDQYGYNQILSKLDEYSRINKIKTTVYHHVIFDLAVQQNYPNLNFIFCFKYVNRRMYAPFLEYTQQHAINYSNFICSFNGHDHVGRQMLLAILHRFGFFNKEYCSKNFIFDIDRLDGNLQPYVDDKLDFYFKFFVSDNSADFFQSINSFGYNPLNFDRYNYVYMLEKKIAQSFLHIVSETMATSYVPFVTEKFLYSVVNKGLFLTYGQPGWHAYTEQYFGFKKYNKLFDYSFDTIQNPVLRLIELITMVSKFSILSPHDWHDLYLMESDTIEYNYDWYFSQNYLKHLQKYDKQIII